MGRQSEQLERETERIRSELAGSLAELRYRVAPGQIVDQLTEYMREGPSAEFLRNLAREVREKPMPVLVIMIGVAWLAIATSLSRRTVSGSISEPRTGSVDEIGVDVVTRAEPPPKERSFALHAVDE